MHAGLDGFASMSTVLDGGNGEGEFMTRPFTYTGSTLHVNCDVHGGGRMLVALTDSGGDFLPGLGFNRSRAIVGSFVDHVVGWGEKHSQHSVAGYVGRTVRLRFSMAAADLFGFWFQ